MLALAVPLGILVGWLRRGHLENLARLDGRALAVVVAALLIRLGLERAAGSAASPALLIGAEAALYAGIFAAVAIHRRRRGVWLVGAGGALNLVAIALHGGRMPVWTAVAGRVGGALRGQLQAGALLTHAPMAAPQGLGWLGDVISLPSPLPPEILSIGDVLLICGVVVFLSSAMAAPELRSRGSGGGA